MGNLIRYTSWYDPQFPLEQADYSHAQDDDPSLIPVIDDLVEDISQNGLRNPVLVTCKNTKWIIHPGKCRSRACARLGWTHIPAIIVNYDLPGFQYWKIPEGCTALASQSQVNQRLDKDMRGKMCHRWLTVKRIKRDNLDLPYV